MMLEIRKQNINNTLDVVFQLSFIDKKIFSFLCVCLSIDNLLFFFFCVSHSLSRAITPEKKAQRLSVCVCVFSSNQIRMIASYSYISIKKKES